MTDLFWGAGRKEIEGVLRGIPDNHFFSGVRETALGTNFADDECFFSFLREQDLRFLAYFFELMGFAEFEFEKITIDKARISEMKIAVKQKIQEVSRGYRYCFSYNFLPIFEEIAELEKDLRVIRENPSLLPSEDEAKKEKILRAIAKKKEILEKMKGENPDFVFLAKTRKSEFPSDAVTLFSWIPTEAVQRFLDPDFVFENYLLRISEISS